jgi:hypothetical protein
MYFKYIIGIFIGIIIEKINNRINSNIEKLPYINYNSQDDNYIDQALL